MTTNPPEPLNEPDRPDQSAESPESAGPADSAESEHADSDRQATAQIPLDQPTGPAPATPSFAPTPPPVEPTGPWSGAGASWAPSGGPPPGYDQPPRRPSRLQRSSTDKMLTGVCGGLGRHTGVDPILFRIGFVALVFAAGTGILLYLALAVLMPRDDGQQVWSRTGDQRVGTGDASYGSPGTPQATPAHGPPPPPPVPQGPPSPVPGVTVAILLIGLGMIALGSRYGGWSLDPSTYFAMAVAAVGAALLVTAFGPWRRSKAGLITLGLFLSFGLFVTSAVDSRGGFDQATFGERNYRPVSADQVRDTYEVVMGQGTLDLSDLQFTDREPAEIQVDVTMGSFMILLPPDADVQLNGDAVFGSVSAFGNRDVIDGYYQGLGEEPDVGDDDPELILEIDVRFGNVEVSRVR